MGKFSEWLKKEGFDFVTQKMPIPELSPNFGKAGLSDDSKLPMGMRKPAITSAFPTYKLKSRKSSDKLP